MERSMFQVPRSGFVFGVRRSVRVRGFVVPDSCSAFVVRVRPNPEPGTWNREPEPEPGTGTWNLEPGTRNSELGTWNDLLSAPVSPSQPRRDGREKASAIHDSRDATHCRPRTNCRRLRLLNSH